MRVRKFLHLFLFLVVGLLSWRIAETWWRPLEEQRPPGQPSAEEETPLPPARPMTPQVGKRYADGIADKDLFVPSRTRALVEAKAVAAVPPPSHLKLVGVMLARGKEEAFFADSSQGGKVIRARKGETLGSYKLVSVGSSQATLAMGQDGNEVSMPLLVLDSNTAVQAQRLMPAQMRQNPARLAQQIRQGAQPQPGAARPGTTPPGPESQPPAETRAIRQNIQQLQQRLRQIRKQAAGDAADDEDDDEDDDSGDEEDEE
ncbi:MAG: hypothetical protein HYZ50_19660 [Deltaproteobacteria bacterium]|nr:hypothetical protein [Deltaproteobacteria bacterium]